MTGGAIGGGVVIRTDDATAPRIASSRSLLAMTVLLGLSELGTKARRDVVASAGEAIQRIVS
jgi:hypothetical protein